MTAPYNPDPRIAGTIKFKKKFPLATLVDLMHKLKSKGEGDDRFLDLHIRDSGDEGNRYLAFHARMREGGKKAEKRAVHELIGFLIKHLGMQPRSRDKRAPKRVPNGVVGWSISEVVVTAL